MINGKFSIDYYRKSTYLVKVDDAVKEVVLLNNTFLPEHATRGSYGSKSQIKLEGEERIVYEAKAFLVLNSQGQDTPQKVCLLLPRKKTPKK